MGILTQKCWTASHSGKSRSDIPPATEDAARNGTVGSGWRFLELGILNSDFPTLSQFDSTNPFPIEGCHHQVCVISTEGPKGPSGEICGSDVGRFVPLAFS